MGRDGPRENENMSQSDAKNAALPRRGFIQKAASGLGAAALGGLGVKEAEAAKAKRHWDLAAVGDEDAPRDRIDGITHMPPATNTIMPH